VKKTAKHPLRLATETVRQLGAVELETVGGGLVSHVQRITCLNECLTGSCFPSLVLTC